MCLLLLSKPVGSTWILSTLSTSLPVPKDEQVPDYETGAQVKHGAEAHVASTVLNLKMSRAEFSPDSGAAIENRFQRQGFDT